MRKMIPGCALVLLGIALSASAQAQWKWRDASGQINYSDQPPPVSVPAARILSMGAPQRSAAAPSAPQGASADAAGAAPRTVAAAQPSSSVGTGTAAESAAPATGGGAPGQPGAAAKPASAAERLTERRKRQAEKEAVEQKAREQEQLEARVAQWCEDLRGRERLLESGMRVASVQANGEQTFMEDEERQAQLQSVRRDLREKCSSGS